MEKTILILSGILGLILGSFLNVLILRLPKNQTLWGRSLCPHCNKVISWYDNIPLLSFLILNRKCRNCKNKISFQYPLVEALTGTLSVLTLLHVDYDTTYYLLWFIFFICPLVAISFIDFKHKIIPDSLSLSGIITGVFTQLILQWPWWKNALIQSGLGILVGGGFFLAIAMGYYFIRKKEGLGGGDIKLGAMLGAFLGWEALIWVFMIGSFSGLIYGIFYSFSKKAKTEPTIPYGPFLAFGAILWFFFQNTLLTWW